MAYICCMTSIASFPVLVCEKIVQAGFLSFPSLWFSEDAQEIKHIPSDGNAITPRFRSKC